MNCRPAVAFEKGDHIGDFLANSKNGVIFVSFGSVLKASQMAQENKEILINVFKRFPQYDILWKWDQGKTYQFCLFSYFRITNVLGLQFGRQTLFTFSL